MWRFYFSFLFLRDNYTKLKPAAAPPQWRAVVAQQGRRPSPAWGRHPHHKWGGEWGTVWCPLISNSIQICFTIQNMCFKCDPVYFIPIFLVSKILSFKISILRTSFWVPVYLSLFSHLNLNNQPPAYSNKYFNSSSSLSHLQNVYTNSLNFFQLDCQPKGHQTFLIFFHSPSFHLPSPSISPITSPQSYTVCFHINRKVYIQSY